MAREYARIRCETCFYWSNFDARSIFAGVIEAKCLNEHSPNFEQYIIGSMKCSLWTNGKGKTIDNNDDSKEAAKEVKDVKRPQSRGRSRSR